MDKAYKKNNEIKDKNIKLVMSDGTMRGIIDTKEALKIADDLNMDLVEVCPSINNNLTICKILDYGKLKYKENKKKNHEHKEVIKEMKFSFNISDHDLEIKHKKIINFLLKKYKVKYTLELKGRENKMINEVKEKINIILKSFEGMAKWEEPQIKGRKIIIFLIPA